MDTLLAWLTVDFASYRDALPWLAMAVALATLGLSWWGSAAVRHHLGDESGNDVAPDAQEATISITVLKPLCGADPGLEENLRSFLLQDHPSYEVLFSVADPRDPAVAVVNRLLNGSRAAGCTARLIVGAEDAGINPKVNNLIRGFDQATNDWVLISDSNVRAERDYLRHLSSHVNSRTGLVTQLVAGTDGEGTGGLLEEVFLNSFYVRNALLASRIGRPCVVGKCMLFRRSVIARVGGIRSLANHLAEDFVAGERIHALGLEIVTARRPVRQVIGNHAFRAFWNRHVRWGRIRRSQAPGFFLVEPFFTPMGSALLAAWAWPVLSGHGTPFAAFCTQILLCLLADVRVMPRLGTESLHKLIGGWLLREALHLPLWFNILYGKKVLWRGQLLTLGRGGVLVSSKPVPVKAWSKG